MQIFAAIILHSLHPTEIKDWSILKKGLPHIFHNFIFISSELERFLFLQWHLKIVLQSTY
jgi:hypothetical protein